MGYKAYGVVVVVVIVAYAVAVAAVVIVAAFVVAVFRTLIVRHAAWPAEVVVADHVGPKQVLWLFLVGKPKNNNRISYKNQ